ncbi:MAG TPA: AAA family ATPase [Pyrinomonadaceae bacterium]
MMTYFLESHFDSGEIYSSVGSPTAKRSRSARNETVHLLAEKMCVPRCRGLIKRPRLDDLLRRSTEQFPATLVSGRAGTGKTTLAAAFARSCAHVGWYSVESSDTEWNAFIHYFAACVLRAVKSKAELVEIISADSEPSQAAVAASLINIFAEAETTLRTEPMLIVLDGIHHLFDAPWFGEFFGLLLSSLPDRTSLLLLCRSKPPSPLWRMRSKQQLNVIDEKLLAFDLAETAALATKHGLKRPDAERAHAETFGRISKLLDVIERAKPRKHRI